MYHPAAYTQHAADQPHQANEPGQYAQPVYVPVDPLSMLNAQIYNQSCLITGLIEQIKDLTEKVSKPESDEARKAEIEKLQAELIQVKHERDEARREVARLNLAVLETERRTKNDMLAQNKQEVERKLAQAKDQHDKELAMLSQQDALELTVTKQRHAVELERLKEANERNLSSPWTIMLARSNATMLPMRLCSGPALLPRRKPTSSSWSNTRVKLRS